jgi:hypothetical protein
MASKEELSTLIQTVLGLKRGTFLVIGTDGEARLVQQKPTIDKIHKAISTVDRQCTCCDSISLRVPGAGGRMNLIVMMVDDTGMLDELPKNDLAFYIANTIKSYPHDIHGTAVIVNDEDFA